MDNEETGSCSEDGTRENCEICKWHLQIDATLRDLIIGGMTFWKQQINGIT
jgi:hypothetical protein